MNDWCYFNQNPSLLLNLDLSTYSWICSLGTGSSTSSLTLNEAYLDGSKSLGLWWTAPLMALHLSTSFNWTKLNHTLTCLPFSSILTIWPNEGITLMLMLLYIDYRVPVCSEWVLEWHDLWYDLNINKFYLFFLKQHQTLWVNLRSWVDRNFFITSSVTFLRFYWWFPINVWSSLIKIFLISPVNIFPVLYFSPIS